MLNSLATTWVMKMSTEIAGKTWLAGVEKEAL
jgi:hypothetical protein